MTRDVPKRVEGGAGRDIGQQIIQGASPRKTALGRPVARRWHTRQLSLADTSRLLSKQLRCGPARVPGAPGKAGCMWEQACSSKPAFWHTELHHTAAYMVHV